MATRLFVEQKIGVRIPTTPKMNKKYLKSLTKTLLGIPQDIEILGFYKDKPILHDPKHPTPDGMVYFINDNNFELK